MCPLRKWWYSMSLKNRFQLVLLFIFCGTIFKFLLFNREKTTILPRLSKRPTNLLNLSNLNRLRLQQMLDNEGTKSFLDYFEKKQINLFLVEPFLLYNYLSREQQDYFVAKNLNPKVLHYKYDLITFGFKVKQNLPVPICQKDLPKSLECVTLYGENNTKEWQLNDPIETQRKPIAVSYLFVHKASNYRIQLVPFYLRTASLWTGKIKGAKHADLKFGQYEELFDDFELIRPFESVRIPENPFAFLMHKNNSRLIECDRVTATDYYKKYSSKDPQESKFARQSEATIRSFKAMMSDYRMPFWLSSGTLLGWYRQCNIISFTTDLDFEADSRFASQKMTESLLKNEYGFRFLYVWGIVSKGYEYTLMRNGIKGKNVNLVL